MPSGLYVHKGTHFKNLTGKMSGKKISVLSNFNTKTLTWVIPVNFIQNSDNFGLIVGLTNA